MSKKIKLLIYSHDWFPVLGGVQTVTLSLASGLVAWSKSHAEESIEVIFVTQTPGNGMDDSQLPFRVVRRPSIGRFVSLVRWADVIDLAGPTLLPLAISYVLRKATVLEHHGYQSVCPNGLLVYEPDRSVCPGHFMAGRYLKCLECNKVEMGLMGSLRNLCLTFPRRWLAKRATINVGVSPHVAQRVALPRTTTIWNGVATNVEPLSAEELCGDSRSICFGYLGRLVTEKGLPVLLRASRALVSKGFQFRLRIVGDGPERSNLEKLTHDYGLADRTEFVGSVPPMAIRESLRGVAVIVMPSVCEDVAPLVAIEQMMEGRLLIGSDIGGLGLISNGGGLKFTAGDAEGLASRMRQVIENPSAVPEMGRRCRNHALETFSLDRMVEEHARLYRELMQRKSRVT
jgi:glycosyltransferase involved in cell wall biosynthesis